MKRISIIILLSIYLPVLGQYYIGKYRYLDNFEKISEIELFKNGKFYFKCNLGGCQTEVTGSYQIENNKIIFKNEKEFINPDFPGIFYPDMSKVNWKINSKWIMPLKKINCGCFMNKNKYLKL